jgi:hypothetical protein
MGIRRLVDPVESMRRSDITRRKPPDPKEVWEEARPRVRWVAGSILGHTCPVFTDEQLGRHSGSRANPRPYMPTFTDEQGQQEQVEDFVEQLAGVPRNTTVWI